MERIMQTGKHYVGQKCANETKKESIQQMYTPNNDIWLWDPIA